MPDGSTPDWFIAWRWAEALANLFYDPLVFWTVPLLLAVIREWYLRAARRRPP